MTIDEPSRRPAAALRGPAKPGLVDERDLGALARQLPVAPADPAHHAALRAAVLREVRGERAAPRSRWRVAGVVGMAADLLHTARLEGGINDEIVRVRRGQISVAVERLAPDQRFRVIAGDGEVEVRGTAFDVVVSEDRLIEVVVHHGLVEVRLAGVAPVAVAGGERWSRAGGAVKVAVAAPAAPISAQPTPSPPAPAISAQSTPSDSVPPPSAPAISAQSTPSPPPQPTPRPPVPPPVPAPAISAQSTPSDSVPTPPSAPPISAPSTPPTPSATSTTERAFRAGRDALRAGDFGVAAARFGEAVAADPLAPLAEDARYWHGVALARAGRDGDARRALADFLARHPQSVHGGRASLVLGNLLVRAGDHAAARTRFEAARRDSDPDVRRTAQAALAAIP